MTWLLDACVLLRAENAGRLVELLHAAEHVPCALVREVYVEVTQPRTTKPDVIARAREAKRNIDASRVAVKDIPVLSTAARRYAAFRSGRATANDAGEAASVALAASDDGLVFVTAEKGATWLGVREAYPRCTVLPWFLRTLVEHGAMQARVAAEIAGTDPTPLPAWWPEWLSQKDTAA